MADWSSDEIEAIHAMMLAHHDCDTNGQMPPDEDFSKMAAVLSALRLLGWRKMEPLGSEFGNYIDDSRGH